MRRKSHGDTQGGIVTTGPGQLHVDGFQGGKVPSPEGYKGGYIFVDDYDNTMYVVGYTTKSEALRCFQEYVAWCKLTA